MTMNIFDKWKVQRAFVRVKNDLSHMKTILTNGLFSLSTEYAKLLLRVQNLERKIEQLEAQRQEHYSYNYAKSY